MQLKNEQIEESLAIIQALDQHYRGEAQETRIRVLSLLLEEGMVIVGC